MRAAHYDQMSMGYGSISNVSGPHGGTSPRDNDLGRNEDDVEAAFVGELFGTLLYVQMGCAANCVAAYTQAELSSWWSVAVVWAIALTLGIYIAIPISGGHLNPAVTLGFAFVRPHDFDFRSKLVPYLLAQMIGAMTAATLNLFLFDGAISSFEQENNIIRGTDDSIRSAVGFGNYFSLNQRDVRNDVNAFFIEAFGTAVLVFVIFALTSRRNTIPGVAIPPAIGATLGVLIALFGPMTGGSFNPARDLGPRVVTFVAQWKAAALQDVWPYVVGPLVGGPIGAFLAENVLYMNEEIF